MPLGKSTGRCAETIKYSVHVKCGLIRYAHRYENNETRPLNGTRSDIIAENGAFPAIVTHPGGVSVIRRNSVTFQNGVKLHTV